MGFLKSLKLSIYINLLVLSSKELETTELLISSSKELEINNLWFI